MDNANKEQIRITLAITFIATYLTIIIGFSDKIKAPSSLGLNVLNDLAFGIFIIFGILIIILFFFYLVFSALELDFNKEKEVIFEQSISKKRIDEVRKSLFNWGVRWIFISFSYPIYYLGALLMKAFTFLIAMLLWIFCLLLIYILLFIIFRDRKRKR